MLVLRKNYEVSKTHSSIGDSAFLGALAKSRCSAAGPLRSDSEVKRFLASSRASSCAKRQRRESFGVLRCPKSTVLCSTSRSAY